MLPPFAFLSFDLTSRSMGAKIIRISQILIDSKGQQHFSEHLFNNDGVAISEDVQEYLGLTESTLKNKPLLTSKTFDFKCAKNIVVWDGMVTKALLKNNGIIGYSPVINLHSLARYLEDVPKPISLKNFVLNNIPHKKIQLEILLRKPENKVKVLVDVYESLSQAYLNKYGVNKPSFLVVVGKSTNKKKALSNISAYLEIWAQENRTNNDYLKNPNEPLSGKFITDPGNKRKVISVNLGKSNDLNAAKKVVVKKKFKW